MKAMMLPMKAVNNCVSEKVALIVSTSGFGREVPNSGKTAYHVVSHRKPAFAIQPIPNPKGNHFFEAAMRTEQ